MRLLVHGHDLPRRAGASLYVGVQRGRDVEQLVPATADAAQFTLELVPRGARVAPETFHWSVEPPPSAGRRMEQAGPGTGSP